MAVSVVAACRVLASTGAMAAVLSAVACGGLTGGSATDGAILPAMDVGSEAGCTDAAYVSIDPDATPAGPLLLDTKAAYWIGYPGGSPEFVRDAAAAAVLRTSKESLFTETLSTPCDQWSLAADRDHLFFTDSSGHGTVLYAVRKAGGTRKMLAQGLPSVSALVTDDIDVYFSYAGLGKPGSLSKAQLGRVGKTGGPVESVPAYSSAPCAAPSSDATCAPLVFGVDADDVYWAVWAAADWDHPLTVIGATSKTNGTVRQVLEVPFAPYSFLLGDTDVYFTTLGPGTTGAILSAVAKNGGSPRTLASGLGQGALATDGHALYAEGIPGTVVKVPFAGGSVSATPVRGSLGIVGLAVDDSDIYFGQGGELQIDLYRVCK